MWITRALALGSLLLGIVLPMPAQASENDSACVGQRNNTLYNKCNFSVDVWFCVVNPRQTKHFFDGSSHFECPNGGLSALGPGQEEGNILHGTVHWAACSTEHRATNRWRYVEGAGYKGFCIPEKGKSTQRQASPSSDASLASPHGCEIMAKDLEGMNSLPNTPEVKIERAAKLYTYANRGCGKATNAHKQEFLDAYRQLSAECKRARGRNCDPLNAHAISTAQRPVPQPSASPAPDQKQPSMGSGGFRQATLADCKSEQQQFIKSFGDDGQTRGNINRHLYDANEPPDRETVVRDVNRFQNSERLRACFLRARLGVQ